MKVFDCITYFDEPLLFEIRLNILDDYVDEFVVSEALFTHSGNKKKINFNINDFPKFKNRITHVVVEKEPEGLIEITETNKANNSIFRLNAAKRIEHQRNKISSIFSKKNLNDWIIYSDSDEIPNLNKFNFKTNKNKIILFNQSVFHYKFNLLLSGHDWFGSKACKFKYLNTISDLRNIKTKKYEFWRIDTLFKKDKYINLKIVEKGGWHFTELKSPEEIYNKHKNDEHHDEFDLTGIEQTHIEDMVKNKYIPYDHSVDKTEFSKKWNKNNRVYLSKITNDNLPKYLVDNKSKYFKWFD